MSNIYLQCLQNSLKLKTITAIKCDFVNMLKNYTVKKILMNDKLAKSIYSEFFYNRTI